MRGEIREIINNRKKLHPNDPKVEEYWEELTEVLVRDESETIDFLNECSEEDISWISEVFEDISEQLNSIVFIKALEKIEKKYPNLDLHDFIEDAKDMLQ